MKRNAKIFCAALALVLVFGAVVGGTLAWLTDKTETVVNTFTVGNIDITLTETDADSDNQPLANNYKMIPGNDIAKDPKVTVEKGSEASWVFVKIDEIAASIPAEAEDSTDTSVPFSKYITYKMADGWTALTGVEGVYYREQAALTAENAEDAVYDVIKDNKVTVSGEVTKDMMDALSKDGATLPQLKVTAYAIQQASFEAEISEDETVSIAAKKAWDELNSSANS